jgi:hypothetical protein
VDIVYAVRNSDAAGIGAEIVIIDTTRGAFPTATGILEMAHELAFLAVDADHGEMTLLEAAAQVGEIFELEVAVGTDRGRDLLVINAERIAHLMEQAADCVRRDGNAECYQLLGDGQRGAARPAQSGHGIAGCVVCQQTMQDVD